jgi:hypothetical protein
MASIHRRAVGIFSSRPQTASALQALSDSGFSMGDVSIIAKDADHQKAIAGVTVKDEVTNQANTGGVIGAATGGILGGVTGLLVGLGTLTIPGLGPALLAGEAAVVISTLVGGVAGAAAGGLVGALVGLGIPQHRAERYRDRVAQGGYLVMLKGSEHDIAQAEQTLSAAGIEDWGTYPVVDEPRQIRPNGDRADVSYSNSATVGDRRDPNWRDRTADQRLGDRRDPNLASNLNGRPVDQRLGDRRDPSLASNLNGRPVDQRLGDRRDPNLASNLNGRPVDQRLGDRRDPNLASNLNGRPVDQRLGDRPLVEFVGFDNADSQPPSAASTRITETVPRHRQADLRVNGQDSNGQSNLYGEPRRDAPEEAQRPDRGLPGEDYLTAGLPHSSNHIDNRDPNRSVESDRFRVQSHTEERRVVGVFLSRDDMEAGLAQLQQTGFPMHTLSMAVREAEAPDQRQDYYSHSLAGATRLTAGLDRILLPEVGTVLVMGPDAQALANTLASNSSGLETHRSRNGATGLGIAPESARLYRRHLTSGAYLVTLRGNNQDLLQVATTLGERGMHDWGIYDVSYAEARL